jgi:hypothetical protein
MRISRLLVLALAATTVLISTSCKKSNDTNNNATLSATIGGTVVTPPNSVGVFWQSNNYFDVFGFTVKGTDTTVLDINIPSGFKLNTAVVNGGEYFVGYQTGNKQYLAGMGYGGTTSFTVTSWDSTGHKIAGTFTASLYNISNGNDSLLVTNGKFNTTYTVQ